MRYRYFSASAAVFGLSAVLLSGAASAETPANVFQSDLLFHSLRHGVSQIYLANSVTGETKRLRESTQEDIGAKWSPDGKKIAFVSRDKGNSDIYIVDADGTNLHRLTDHPAFDGGVAWSPDGSQLAFTSGRSGSSKVYVINVDGSGLKRLTASTLQEDEVNQEWSPDGKRLAFVTLGTNRDATLWVVGSDGSGLEQLSKPADGKSVQPAWSPDSREIVYIESKKGRANLRVMNLANKTVSKLTDDDFRSSKPQWTADGRHIVFESLRAGGVRSDLFMIPSKGGEVVNLTATPGDEEMDCSLAGNGRNLAYARFLDGKPAQLYVLDLGSKVSKRMTQTGALEFQPAWRPMNVPLSSAAQVSQPTAIASLH